MLFAAHLLQNVGPCSGLRVTCHPAQEHRRRCGQRQLPHSPLPIFRHCAEREIKTQCYGMADRRADRQAQIPRSTIARDSMYGFNMNIVLLGNLHLKKHGHPATICIQGTSTCPWWNILCKIWV